MIEKLKKIKVKFKHVYLKYHYKKKIRSVSYLEGWNIFGHFSYNYGCGEAARTIARQFIFNNKVSLINLPSKAHREDNSSHIDDLAKLFTSELTYKNNLFLIDVEEMVHFKNHAKHIFNNRQNTIWFWWEFEDGFIQRFNDALDKIDELIVFTDFIYDLCRKSLPSSIRLRQMDYPFVPPSIPGIEKTKMRLKYQIPFNKFVLFFNFDYLSGYSRKNPDGIIKALFLLPQDVKDNIYLIIKTINSEKALQKAEKLRSLIESLGFDNSTLIVDLNMPKDEMISLMYSADCYISLHRGEGLGLGIVEAYSLGLSVIATGYGGIVSFMNNKQNCSLVKYSIVDAKDDYKVYRNVTKWAEPDYFDASRAIINHYYKYNNTTDQLT